MKLNSTNKFYQTKSRETKYTENQSKVKSQLELQNKQAMIELGLQQAETIF